MHFDVEQATAELIAMRVKHGAKSPLGQRISNLIQQINNLKTATGKQREKLLKVIEESMADIRRLTPERGNSQ